MFSHRNTYIGLAMFATVFTGVLVHLYSLGVTPVHAQQYLNFDLNADPNLPNTSFTYEYKSERACDGYDPVRFKVLGVIPSNVLGGPGFCRTTEDVLKMSYDAETQLGHFFHAITGDTSFVFYYIPGDGSEYVRAIKDVPNASDYDIDYLETVEYNGKKKQMIATLEDGTREVLENTSLPEFYARINVHKCNPSFLRMEYGFCLGLTGTYHSEYSESPYIHGSTSDASTFKTSYRAESDNKKATWKLTFRPVGYELKEGVAAREFDCDEMTVGEFAVTKISSNGLIDVSPFCQAELYADVGTTLDTTPRANVPRAMFLLDIPINVLIFDVAGKTFLPSKKRYIPDPSLSLICTLGSEFVNDVSSIPSGWHEKPLVKITKLEKPPSNHRVDSVFASDSFDIMLEPPCLRVSLPSASSGVVTEPARGSPKALDAEKYTLFYAINDQVVFIESRAFTRDFALSGQFLRRYDENSRLTKEQMTAIDNANEAVIQGIKNKSIFKIVVTDANNTVDEIIVPIAHDLCVPLFNEHGPIKVIYARANINGEKFPISDLWTKAEKVRTEGFEKLDPYMKYSKPENGAFFGHYMDLNLYDATKWSQDFTDVVGSASYSPTTHNYFFRDIGKQVASCGEGIKAIFPSTFYSPADSSLSENVFFLARDAVDQVKASGSVPASFATIAMHELSHAFVGLNDEYLYGSAVARKFSSLPLKNCSTTPSSTWLYKKVQYGDTSYKGCTFSEVISKGFVAGKEKQLMVPVYRPADKNLMNASKTGEARLDAVSCGYVIARIKGGSAASYWPECLRLNTVKPTETASAPFFIRLASIAEQFIAAQVPKVFAQSTETATQGGFLIAEWFAPDGSITGNLYQLSPRAVPTLTALAPIPISFSKVSPGKIELSGSGFSFSDNLVEFATSTTASYVAVVRPEASGVLSVSVPEDLISGTYAVRVSSEESDWSNALSIEVKGLPVPIKRAASPPEPPRTFNAPSSGTEDSTSFLGALRSLATGVYNAVSSLLGGGGNKTATLVSGNTSTSKQTSFTLGNQPVLVLLVDYTDSETRPFTRDEAHNLIFQGDFSKFYAEQSYGKISFTGDVFGWFRMNRPMQIAAGYPVTDQELEMIIAENGIDLDNYHYLVTVVSHPRSGGGGAYAGPVSVLGHTLGSIQVGLAGYKEDGGFWKFDNFSFSLSHEMAHALGLNHASYLSCSKEMFQPSLFDSCIQENNYYQIIGNPQNSAHLSAFSKEFLGWFMPDNVEVATSSGEYSLTPLENPIGIKLVKIPVSDTESYYLEYRRGVGYDSNLNKNFLANNQDGLFVYYVRPGGNQFDPVRSPALLVDMSPAFPYLLANDGTILGYWDQREVVLRVGKTFTDKENKIIIGPVLSANDSRIVFRVDKLVADMSAPTPVVFAVVPQAGNPRILLISGTGFATSTNTVRLASSASTTLAYELPNLRAIGTTTLPFLLPESIPSGTYLVSVRAGGGVWSNSLPIDVRTSPAVPLRILSPEANDIFHAGALMSVTWSGGPSGTSTPMRMSFWRSGTATTTAHFKLIQGITTPNDGSESWVIPKDVLPGFYFVELACADKATTTPCLPKTSPLFRIFNVQSRS